MIRIRTVCGNGIGSSLLCATEVKKICKEYGIDADVESVDFSNAEAQKADLYVTVKQIADQFNPKYRVAVIRSYTNKKKIEEDIIDIIKEISIN